MIVCKTKEWNCHLTRTGHMMTICHCLPKPEQATACRKLRQPFRWHVAKLPRTPARRDICIGRSEIMCCRAILHQTDQMMHALSESVEQDHLFKG